MKAKKFTLFLLTALFALFLSGCEAQVDNEQRVDIFPYDIADDEENIKHSVPQFGQVAASFPFREQEESQIPYEEAAQLVAAHMSENFDVNIEDLVALVDFSTRRHFDLDPIIIVWVSLSMAHISRADYMYQFQLNAETGELIGFVRHYE